MIALAAALLLFVHGEAEWIMREPRYRADDGVHCCGPTDCERLPDGSVTEGGGAYRLDATGETMRWGDPGVYLSRDDHYWACHRGGRLRCLFVPGRMG